MRGTFFAGSAREKPPLTGEVAERSDGLRGFGRYPSASASREAAGRACPAPTVHQNLQMHTPDQVIFSARCTRYTIYRNSPTIKLPSTQI